MGTSGGTDPIVVAVTGELDAASAAATRDRILAEVTADQQVAVDLTGVEFVDSSGLGVLIAAARAARDAGGELVVINPQPRVCRLIETAGLAHLFGIETDEGVADPDAATGDDDAAAPADDALLDDVRTLLLGYENLLRWGDLTPEQMTIALRGAALAEATSDLELAAKVRAVLTALGVRPPPSAPE